MIHRSALLALAGLAIVPAGVARAAPDGAALYAAHCSVCHQAQGVGAPGQFPPLKGRIDRIAASAPGRAYLADVVLNGLSGVIHANGKTFMGFMPSFKTMSDDEIAAVLSGLSALGDTHPAPVITADEVKAQRATPKPAKAVLAERKALEDAHAVP